MGVEFYSNDELLSRYDAIESSLSKIPEVAGVEENAADKKEISDAQIIDAYSSILEVSKVLDYDTLMFILDSIKEYRLSPDDEQLMSKISKLAYKLKWDEITELVQNRLNS